MSNYLHKLSYVVAITLVTSLAVIVLLALNGEWFAIFTGLAAPSPDAAGLYNWLGYEKQSRAQPAWLIAIHVKFHRSIQWCERPWGIIVEMLVFTILGYALCFAIEYY